MIQTSSVSQISTFAPTLLAAIAKIPLPVPTSITSLSFFTYLDIASKQAFVVSWCPEPKDKAGSIMISILSSLASTQDGLTKNEPTSIAFTDSWYFLIQSSFFFFVCIVSQVIEIAFENSSIPSCISSKLVWLRAIIWFSSSSIASFVNATTKSEKISIECSGLITSS